MPLNPKHLARVLRTAFGLTKTFVCGLLLIGACSAVARGAHSSSPPSDGSGLSTPGTSLQDPPFVSTNWNIGITLGAGVGISETHDLATATLHFGRQLDSDQSTPKPFLHHLELGLELWGNKQFHPTAAYIVGITPTLRYRLLPDSRWTPFFDIGAGFSVTDIDQTDGTALNLDLLAGLGLQWRWRENAALTFQARYLRLVDANVAFSDDAPGFGLVLFSGGVTWFF